MSILAIIFAVLGLSFLIFIHELGHYLMAKKAKMKIEVFSIGMGKPIFSWKSGGVKWQICYLLFGGYVKIAGMEGENGLEAHQIKKGFYSKKPVYRLLVAAAGPVVNIVFAVIGFSVIYMCGGQEKPFAQYTKIIGEMDLTSSIYEEGVRAGDSIISIADKPYKGFNDVLIQGMMKSNDKRKVVFENSSGEKKESLVSFYQPQLSAQKSFYPPKWKSMGVLAPATYITMKGFEKHKQEFAPLGASSIENGDRVIYADGEIIYSYAQLSDIVNRDVALVTIENNGKKRSVQVPRVILSDLKLTAYQEGEFIDSKREMNLESAFASTHFIPYLVSDNLIIDEKLDMIEEGGIPSYLLEKGDKIVAVNGNTVESLADFYREIESRKCLIMLSNMDASIVSYTDCDKEFHKGLDKEKIAALEATLGSEVHEKINGYRFLAATKPVQVKSYLENSNMEAIAQYKEKMPKERFTEFMQTKTLFSGLDVRDKMVTYNPTPFQECKLVVKDIFFSLSALVTGKISPKHMAGPVGMVKKVHDSTKSSYFLGLYWLSYISLNLAVLNLLPIPMLDGGHICFTMYEMITKRRLKAKTIQKMIMPFAVLFITFFVYVTFNDLLKVFG